ncbi:DNA phosphorothioation system sulfurtransferase DndC [Pseudidiomarina donghaiensis]|jgi:DNA sulfur modification protein DndC|uniref:DNA phosphorothioation system sulfurtransferase DndC n=1 Tax=Pseudidiomarina donghaiensis TaxID=519452 RepID=UPI003A96A423
MTIQFKDNIYDEYIEFSETEMFAGRTLSHSINDVQNLYLSDNRPWVIGYSGGKDSSAVVTLIYLSLWGLSEEQRHKPVFVVASDTLVETPKVVDHVNRSLEAIERGAKKHNIPISCHKVVPKTKDTFWVNLLGKGYPAPTRSFRWCTERMKIDPVSSFIKEKVSEYDEVIVVLGSRMQESSSRAQVIMKHKLDGTVLAKHTTLANAYIYTPIDTWSVDEVWKSLRLCKLQKTESPSGVINKWIDEYDLEWDAPWGGKNLTLWNLYRDSSDQGECPMVIDESTPSCGNSRFGCWTCTVVTKDRAMESLIQSGEDWMKPLLKFRNILSRTTSPKLKKKYRSHIRRDGRMAFKSLREDGERILTDDFTTGPYRLKYRKYALRLLLSIQKKLASIDKSMELITVPELYAIREEWIKDPNEPDWDDSLPKIVQDTIGINLEWKSHNSTRFGDDASEVLEKVANEHGLSSSMIKKLIDLEFNMSGLSRRSGIFKSIGKLVQQDWESAEQIMNENLAMRQNQMQQSRELKGLEEDLAQLNSLLNLEAAK